MEQQDIRWKQRFQNYDRAFRRLENDRNLTSHTYDDAVAEGIITDIRNHYFLLLKELHQWLKNRL